jgi:hypothetical protein
MTTLKGTLEGSSDDLYHIIERFLHSGHEMNHSFSGQIFSLLSKRACKLGLILEKSKQDVTEFVYRPSQPRQWTISPYHLTGLDELIASMPGRFLVFVAHSGNRWKQHLPSSVIITKDEIA